MSNTGRVSIINTRMFVWITFMVSSFGRIPFGRNFKTVKFFFSKMLYVWNICRIGYTKRTTMNAWKGSLQGECLLPFIPLSSALLREKWRLKYSYTGLSYMSCLSKNFETGDSLFLRLNIYAVAQQWISWPMSWCVPPLERFLTFLDLMLFHCLPVVHRQSCNSLTNTKACVVLCALSSLHNIPVTFYKCQCHISSI